LSVIRNSKNRGFAAACNQGAQKSDADYLLFLNPDTVLIDDSLITPLHFMQQPENSKIGICGIQLVDALGNVNRTCSRFPTPGMFFFRMLGLVYLFPQIFHGQLMTDWDHRENREVDQIMGAFFLVRRCLFEALGGFDERFFVYFEEVDFSLRARQADWSSFYLSDAQAYHKGGGTSEQVKAVRLFYSLRSRILYGFKHFGYFSAIGLMLGTLLLEPLARFFLGIAHCSFKEIIATFKGYKMLWNEIPALLKSV